MTIYSGKTRISEEEDLWRVIGIHEVTDLTNDDRPDAIPGYLTTQGNETVFYPLVTSEYDIYYDLEDEKYKYKSNDTYKNFSIKEGYKTAYGFYQTKLNPTENKIYKDRDQNQYYIYQNNNYRQITQYTYQANGTTIKKLYYHKKAFYRNKESIGPNMISILIGNEYVKYPYVQGTLVNKSFYSDKLTLDSNNIYYDNNNETYYNYTNGNLVESTYEMVTDPDSNGQVVCYINIRSAETEIKTLVTGYKVDNEFYQTVAAGYIDEVVPDGNNDEINVYRDKITNSFYVLHSTGFAYLDFYEQYEEHETHNIEGTVVGNVLYYHNYENETVLHSRQIRDGYFINGQFYLTRVNGDSRTIYHVVDGETLYKYDLSTNDFFAYEPSSYEIGFYYSDKITNPSINKFYENEDETIYYYDDGEGGGYKVTSILNGYYIPTLNMMCTTKISNFSETTLYYDKLSELYYVYKGSGLARITPFVCRIIDGDVYVEQRPMIGATYFDVVSEEYFIYKNGDFVSTDNALVMSDANQIVLSLTKQNLLIDDNILDQAPYDDHEYTTAYDEDAVLTAATSTKAGILTADMYNTIKSLDERYKMRISSTIYDSLADLQSAAPDDWNMIYYVKKANSEYLDEYVRTDSDENIHTYVKIGDTDIGTPDLDDVATVDDVSDILEQIRKQDLRLQDEIDDINTELALKYPTANIITNYTEINNVNDNAVSSKALLDYLDARFSQVIDVSHVLQETVVTDVIKYEDSIQVIYDTITTAVPYEYLTSFTDVNSSSDNRTFSAGFLKQKINDLQSLIDNKDVNVAWQAGKDAVVDITLINRLS